LAKYTLITYKEMLVIRNPWHNSWARWLRLEHSPSPSVRKSSKSTFF
jgi:hypothetical protein